MWKKYEEFLRKRTDKQLLVALIMTILIICFMMTLLSAKNIHLVFNNVPENIIVIIVISILFISCSVMVTCCIEGLRRSAERSKEQEREECERLREELKEEVRKELEQEKK